MAIHQLSDSSPPNSFDTALSTISRVDKPCSDQIIQQSMATTQNLFQQIAMNHEQHQPDEQSKKMFQSLVAAQETIQKMYLLMQQQQQSNQQQSRLAEHHLNQPSQHHQSYQSEHNYFHQPQQHQQSVNNQEWLQQQSQQVEQKQSQQQRKQEQQQQKSEQKWPDQQQTVNQTSQDKNQSDERIQPQQTIMVNQLGKSETSSSSASLTGNDNQNHQPDHWTYANVEKHVFNNQLNHQRKMVCSSSASLTPSMSTCECASPVITNLVDQACSNWPSNNIESSINKVSVIGCTSYQSSNLKYGLNEESNKSLYSSIGSIRQLNPITKTCAYPKKYMFSQHDSKQQNVEINRVAINKIESTATKFIIIVGKIQQWPNLKNSSSNQLLSSYQLSSSYQSFLANQYSLAGINNDLENRFVFEAHKIVSSGSRLSTCLAKSNIKELINQPSSRNILSSANFQLHSIFNPNQLYCFKIGSISSFSSKQILAINHHFITNLILSFHQILAAYIENLAKSHIFKHHFNIANFNIILSNFNFKFIILANILFILAYLKFLSKYFSWFKFKKKLFIIYRSNHPVQSTFESSFNSINNMEISSIIGNHSLKNGNLAHQLSSIFVNLIPHSFQLSKFLNEHLTNHSALMINIIFVKKISYNIVLNWIISNFFFIIFNCSIYNSCNFSFVLY